MKMIDLKKGTNVSDRYYPELKVGVVSSIKRTVVRVKFPTKTVQYEINKALNDLEVSK